MSSYSEGNCGLTVITVVNENGTEFAIAITEAIGRKAGTGQVRSTLEGCGGCLSIYKANSLLQGRINNKS